VNSSTVLVKQTDQYNYNYWLPLSPSFIVFDYTMAHRGPPRFRVVLCGDYGVGKTTLFQRFVVESLDNNVEPTNVEESLPLSQSDQQVTSLMTSNSRKKRSRANLRHCIGIDTFCRQFLVSDGRAVQVSQIDVCKQMTNRLMKSVAAKNPINARLIRLMNSAAVCPMPDAGRSAPLIRRHTRFCAL